MTQVLLFNPHRGGHHLECASRLQSYIHDIDSTISIDFLAPEPDEEYDEYFDAEEISYLFDAGYDSVEKLSAEPAKTRKELVARTIEHAEREEYDFVHFLQLDDLVREVHRYVSDRQPSVEIVGLIVGSYFAAGPVVNRVISRLLRSRMGDTIAPLLPEMINHVGRYRNDQYMYRAMRDGSLARVFVFSELARTYLAELNADYAAEQTVVVPDPTELYFTMDISQEAARDHLGLPADDLILLFFGQMRTEKGIETLFEAIRRYDGPSFRVVIAGSPTDVSDRDIETLRRQQVPDVSVVPEYVPDEELPFYFLAADGVVCPYKRSFGSYRTSNVFQKAAGAARPIIASNFGIFADRIQQWDLGQTFEPESPSALVESFREFVAADGSIGDRERIEQYARSQTYRQWGEQTVEQLQNIDS